MKEQLEAQIGIDIMFTSYIGLWKAIPKEWKRELNGIPKFFNITRPQCISLLTKDKKGTRSIREMFHKGEGLEIPKGQQKWIDELNINVELDWKLLYTLPKKCKLNARSMYFQFQILHRTLITNHKLYQFNIKEDELCEHCGQVDTIVHLLYECCRIRDLWTDLVNWLNIILATPVIISKESIILGDKKNNTIINPIFIVKKHEIYKSKWKKTSINLIKIQNILKSQMELDIFIGTMKNTLPEYLGKWSGFYNVLRNI